MLTLLLIGCDHTKVSERRKVVVDNIELVEMDEGWMINAVVDRSVTELTIPDEYDGAPVVSIQREAFKHCTGIKKLTIPYGVTYVGSYAFQRCTSLKELYISNEKAVIESTAFEGCPIQKAQVPGAHIDIVPKDNLYSLYIAGGTVGKEAFKDFELLTVIGVSGDVKFDEGALDGCGVISFRVLASELDKLQIKDQVFNLIIAPDRETNVTTLYRNAFESYTRLRGITFESYDTTFDFKEGAFDKCTATTFSIPASLLSLIPRTTKNLVITSGEVEYHGNTRYMDLVFLTIKSEVTKVASGAFRECNSLENVTILASVDKIEAYTFYKCPALETIDIGASIKSIEKDAFADCTAIEEITLAGQISSIKESSFKNCSSLAKLTIGSYVTEIGKSAFEGCTSLQLIAIGSGLSSLDSTAFLNCGSIRAFSVSEANNSFKSVDKCLFTKDGKTLIKYGQGQDSTAYAIPAGTEIIHEEAFLNASLLTSVTMPNSVTTIGKRAFESCSSLTSINISNSVDKIEANTFAQCSALRLVVIPDSVTSVGKNAFYKCASLVGLTIGTGVTQIESEAFYGCDELISVIIPKNVEIVGERIFASCDNLVLINCEAKEIPETFDEDWAKGNNAEIALGFQSQSGEI